MLYNDREKTIKGNDSAIPPHPTSVRLGGGGGGGRGLWGGDEGVNSQMHAIDRLCHSGNDEKMKQQKLFPF